MKNRRPVRHLLVLIAVVLVAYVVLHIYRNMPGPVKDMAEETPVRQESDLELRNVAFTETEDGLPVWSLKAASANYSKSGQAVDLEDMEVVFFAPDKSQRAHLQAEHGTVDLVSREVIARGDVRVVTGDGAKFSTEELRYRHDRKELVTEKLAVFDFRGATIQGLGMNYLLDQKLLKLLTEVSADVPFTQGGGAP